MGDNHPSSSTNHDSTATTKVTDMDMDSLVHCTSYLTLQDISNMAVSCKFLNRLVYSDSVWRRLFRERWPQLEPYINSQKSGLREAYLARYSALQQFKFVDPLDSNVYLEGKSSDLLLSKDSVFLSQGPLIQIYSIDKLLQGEASFVSLNDHRARITSMRLFPLKETSLFRNEAHINDNVLVTSSCDHSIRLWWKGSCQRCFRGHNGPVTVLSDKLLGDENGKVFASGGEDSTVRLWSLRSTGKRGQHALKATLYGHEKPIAFMSVTGHRASLIASMSKDSKVRVWDASISSSDRNSSCVGMTSVPGVPVGMKCHDSLLYIAFGSSIGAVDLRTMKTVFRTSTNEGKLYSFDIMPSKFLACTGGLGRALLWDMRKNTGAGDAEPMAELDGHIGPVTHLHMDSNKIVTGGPEDPHISIWAANTGNQTNVLSCSPLDSSGCFAMAADGFRIVTAGYNQEYGVLRFRDFNNAVCSGSLNEHVTGSKFWCPSTSGDGDESDG
ncbi:putative transcription factor WD40-like family [Helianthus annuus]|uniref:Putative F-box domain, Coatomer alpha subunit n=1 Tax=Helianthus annuus TaxID=4232 RepID=A0A251SIU9_HELAN|nr:uncharacterized WD repeat-containing protein alr2800 isoform X1 [Helianthus annuus]KAF5769887.1 putative transcription factor WD40-like family [Helianthus annuus]KAJ0464838.1 putative transcription factor WD40-like family [Helianthus annuus]KAJ0469523.1 putative transcription factor WD40-like family [Helianthus annuus]KAJ0486432.1 putative transcription factor WD40-like family [Helianthus annuus]KAJ0656989.1 putative transcription factor WD40-like family [Helianthus annuus]